MIIYGAVDGFSRLPVSLECVRNNKSETLLSCFIKGVQTYRIPSITVFYDCKLRTRVWKLNM